MSRVDAAAAMDRLPWLSDEPQPEPGKRRGSGGFVWAATAILLVAGAGFWIGERSVNELPPAQPKRAQAVTTVRLPEARPVEPAPQAKPAPVTVVERIIEPPLQRIEQAQVVKQTIPTAPPEPQQAAPAAARAEDRTKTVSTIVVRQPVAAAPRAIVPVSPPIPLRPWQPRVVAGAAGRLVEVGAFGSVQQAKLGWRYMVRDYPAMAHLPAVVRPDRNSKGRVYYRFRVGTTSQAHSEVLCQRMEKIHLSCAVIGLPWKAKVER